MNYKMGGMNYSFADSIQDLRTSEIRDLMSLAARPDVISFAGGMPNNHYFPLDEVDRIMAELPLDMKQKAFQYGPTPGLPFLIDAVKDYLGSKGLPVDENEILITTGSLQAINIIAKAFVDPGDVIITENPCFIGAISAFRSYRADIRPVEMDEEGIIPDKLEQAIDEAGDRLKFIYLTPFFHNPAGTLYSQDRKQYIMDLVKNRNIVLLEDDAYGELWFDEDAKKRVKPMKAILGDDSKVCYVGSFSKIFGPGMRLGWMLVPRGIYQKCELIKQSMDACSPSFTQVLAHQFVTSGKLYDYIDDVRKKYRQSRDIMVDSLKRYMPEEIEWQIPQGGFYIWFKMPGDIDATEVLKPCLNAGAVFVIGKTFDPDGVKNNCFRLSYSNAPVDKIDEGIRIIADNIRAFL